MYRVSVEFCINLDLLVFYPECRSLIGSQSIYVYEEDLDKIVNV